MLYVLEQLQILGFDFAILHCFRRYFGQLELEVMISNLECQKFSLDQERYAISAFFSQHNSVPFAF